MGKHKAKTNPKTVQVASKKREIESCSLDRTSIKIGDCVLVRVEGKNKPDVAKVNKVVEKKKHGVVGVVYCITWYLWPEDTKYGRLSFQGKSELLSSNWSGTVSLESIEGKCTVHTIDDYKHIEKAGPEDFFSRTRYNHTTKDFIPGDTLPVYCWCRRPYNPDYPPTAFL